MACNKKNCCEKDTLDTLEETLQQKVDAFASFMRLGDWRTTVRYKRFHEMPGKSGDVRGCCYPWTNMKNAEIEFLHPDDIDASVPFGLEESYLYFHELAHLYFVNLGIQTESREDTQLEIAVDLIADTMNRLYKGEKPLV